MLDDVPLQWHFIDHAHPLVCEIYRVSIRHPITRGPQVVEILFVLGLWLVGFVPLAERILRLALRLGQGGVIVSLVSAVCGKAFVLKLAFFLEQTLHVCVGCLPNLRLQSLERKIARQYFIDAEICHRVDYLDL